MNPRPHVFHLQAALAAAAALLCGCGHNPPAPAAVEAKDAVQQAGAVSLTPEQLANARLATAKVLRRQEAGLVRATAEIEPAADRVARVGARLEGRIAALKAGAGDTVRKGQLLAVVESPELGRIRADYATAFALAKVTAETADRERRLFDQKISSEREWRAADAEATRARIERDAAANRLRALGIVGSEPTDQGGAALAVVAPLDGVVVERNATLGQPVGSGETLFVLMDLREVWLLVDVYEQDLSQLNLGQSVDAEVSAVPGRTFSGVVANIGAIVEPRSRAVRVRVVVQNGDGALKPGMFATVELQGMAGERQDKLYVPLTAIQRDGADHLLFVTRSDREFEPRRVKLGTERGSEVVVESGVKEGETVVTDGSFNLKSELKRDELGGEE